MELIMTDSNRRDIGMANEFTDVEIDLNKTKRITVKIARSNYDSSFTFGSWIYENGTEYGGMIDDVITTSALDYVELSADTCRGKLDKRVVEPPIGQTHLIMSGDIHDIMRNLVDNQFGGLISVVPNKLGVTLNNYKFDRYDTLLNGLNKMLKSASYKLVARAVRTNDTHVHFELSAEPIIDYSMQADTEDNSFNFVFEDNRSGYNHIIGLGGGEGLEREVVHFYIGADGEVTEQKYFTGFDENIYVYDYSNSDDLIAQTKAKLRDIAPTKKFNMTSINISQNVKIGDLVGGRDEKTGMEGKKPIDNILYSYVNGVDKTTYKLEGES